jgi:predicted nucleic acid-binding protein
MLFAFLDASALAKRYVHETGSPSINYLFQRVSATQLMVFVVGVAEVVSILVRKRNAQRMSAALFAHAWNAFRREVVGSASIRKLSADERIVTASLDFILRYSVNSTDAILLQLALDLASQLRQSGDDLFLAASDQRLLRAAQAEGLTTFNPETQSEQDLDNLLGP